MPSLVLQLSLRCAACGSIVPINAFGPEAACWSCERRTSLDATAWRLLLDEPIKTAGSSSLNVELAASLETESGTYRRVTHLGSPVCGGCRSPLDEAELRARAAQAGVGDVPCPRCQEPVAIRGAPPGLSQLGIVAIAGESTGGRTAPVPLACTSCGGNLSVDGKSRLVTCVYCKATQYLPNELLQRLRAAPVRPWALILSEQLAHSAAPELADWASLLDLVADAHGNLYAWGHVTRSVQNRTLEDVPGTLFSMAPDMTLRWMREDLPLASAGTKLAVTAKGHVLAWDEHAALVMQPTDGAPVARYSGQPDEYRKLETRGARSLLCDLDGSLILYAKDGWLHRFDEAGGPMKLWEETHFWEGKIWGGVGLVGNRPAAVDDARLCIGWDGGLHMHSEFADGDNDGCVIRLDRSGQRTHRGKIRVDKGFLFEARPAADEHGAIYFLGSAPDEDDLTVFRMSPGDKEASRFLVPRTGDLGNPRIAVARDGTLFVADSQSQLRRFGADGRVQFLSRASEALDRKAR